LCLDVFVTWRLGLASLMPRLIFLMQMPCHARKALICMDVMTERDDSPESAHDAFVQRPALPDKSVKLQRSNEKAGGMRRCAD
jgi:hypothetical protein